MREKPEKEPACGLENESEQLPTETIPRVSGKIDFKAIRCSSHLCSQTMFGVDQSFFTEERFRTHCVKCEGEMKVLLYGISEEDPGKLVIRFECVQCKSYLDRALPAFRRYCSKCKRFQLLYFMRLLDCAVSKGTPP